MVDSVLILGAGRFGRHAAIKFLKMGKEVLIVDNSEEMINNILPDVPNAQIGDATREDVLKSLGVDQFDLCVVAIGSHFGASLETTLLLKEFGAKYVIAKATRDIHSKFLLRSGADQVVYPEKQAAERIAMRFSGEHILDYIELNSELSIIEVPILKEWVGKTIQEINVRKNFNLNILATKLGENVSPVTSPDHVLSAGENLFVFGATESVMRFLKKV